MGYILKGFMGFILGVAWTLFIGFVVLPVLFVGFFTSAVYAVQAVSYYLMIKDETYLRRGWSITHADIINENGKLKLYWVTENRSYTSKFHGFSNDDTTNDDTISILYKTRHPKIFILYDKNYWLSKIRKRCIWTVLWGIMFIPLVVSSFF